MMFQNGCPQLKQLLIYQPQTKIKTEELEELVKTYENSLNTKI